MLWTTALADIQDRRRYLLATQCWLAASVTLLCLAVVLDAMTAPLLLVLPAMFIMGMAWLSTANSLGVSVQAALPNWVRARGMSVYQMCITGGGAFGAALWGQVATLASMQAALLAGAASGLLSLLLMRRLAGDLDAEEDLSPAGVKRLPVADESPIGQVVVSVEYSLNPARTKAFLALMEESRRSRLRQGARSWTLLNTLDDRAASWSRSSTNRGPSTCAASTDSPSPMPPCASAGWLFTWVALRPKSPASSSSNRDIERASVTHCHDLISHRPTHQPARGRRLNEQPPQPTSIPTKETQGEHQ